MIDIAIERQFDQAQIDAAQIADNGTIAGLRSQRLVIISLDLYNRLVADSQKLRQSETEAELRPIAWPDSIDAEQSDYGARGDA